MGHRHVVGIYGYFIEPPYFGMVLELCQSTVKVAAVDSKQSANRNLSQDSEWRLNMALQSASVVSYLHSQNPPIIHRDIKWSNFLVAFNGDVKLCDFGESIEYVD